MNSPLHAVTNSVSFHHLQACHSLGSMPLASSIMFVPLLHQSGAGAATS